MSVTRIFCVGFFEGAKVVFSIFIESCKLIGNIYKTTFACSLYLGLKYCPIAKSCAIVERSHVFSLRAEEKDLSPAALVAGFTRSVHYTLNVWSRGKQLVLFSLEYSFC